MPVAGVFASVGDRGFIRRHETEKAVCNVSIDVTTEASLTMNILDRIARPALYALAIGSASASLMLPFVIRERKQSKQEATTVRTIIEEA